jgi:hypothetical protein
MFWLRYAVLWVILLQLPGCADATTSSGVAIVKNIGDIEVGMTQNQVLSILGQPQLRETYGGTEFLIYDSDSGKGIPIAIVGGRVTSIGRTAYDVVVRSKTQADNAIPHSKISN